MYYSNITRHSLSQVALPPHPWAEDEVGKPQGSPCVTMVTRWRSSWGQRGDDIQTLFEGEKTDSWMIHLTYVSFFKATVTLILVHVYAYIMNKDKKANNIENIIGYLYFFALKLCGLLCSKWILNFKDNTFY